MKDHVSWLVKIYGRVKYREHQNQCTHEQKWGFIFLDFESCFFWLFTTFLIIYSFSAFFTYVSMDQANIVNFSSLLALSLRLVLIVYSFYGINQKRKNVLLRSPIREAIAGHLLYRCKHFCIFVFRVVLPSLSETKYVYCINLIIWSQ